VLRRASGVRLLGAHPSGEAALASVPGEKPEVVLMDINLPGMSGIDCIAKLKLQMPGFGVLMLTTYEDSTFDLQFASRRGERLHPQEQIIGGLLDAIQQVHEGGRANVHAHRTGRSSPFSTSFPGRPLNQSV